MAPGLAPARCRLRRPRRLGATLARPALQRLLADITARKVDLVVVYKVDRLTRSLADFARIIEAALEQLRAGNPQLAAHDLARLPRSPVSPPTSPRPSSTEPSQHLTLDRLRRPLPLAWTEQRRAVGFPATGTATTTEPGPCP